MFKKLNRRSRNSYVGDELFLPLPQTRLAKFDEYLTNSHIFNRVIVAQIPLIHGLIPAFAAMIVDSFSPSGRV
jgi:hypothetical protein